MKDKHLREAVKQLAESVGREYSELSYCIKTYGTSLSDRVKALEHTINKEPHFCKVCNKPMEQK